MEGNCKEALDTVGRIYGEACDDGFDTNYDVINELDDLRKHPKPLSLEMSIEIDEMIAFLDARSQIEKSKELESAFLLLCPAASSF